MEIVDKSIWYFSCSHLNFHMISNIILAFENMAEALVGSIILYNSRQFERQLGIKKYTALVVLAYITTIALQLIILAILNSVGVNDYTFASGPYFILFSLLTLYYGKFYERNKFWIILFLLIAHIPKLQSRRSALFGIIEFSEKSWIYFLTLQIVFSQGLRGLGSSLIGLLIGFIYDKDFLYFQTWRLPSFVEV